MIYLQETTESQVAIIPKERVSAAATMTLQIMNTIDRAVTDLVVVDNQSYWRYYDVDVTLPADVVPGEYEYALYDGDHILASGLLVIGGSTAATEYNKTIEYEQYETE